MLNSPTNVEQQSRTLVVGLGITGLSVARYLSAQGLQVAVADSREHPPGLEQLQQEHRDVAVFLGPFDDQLFAQADQLVVSPGVPLSTPQIQAAQARGVSVIGDIELFASAARAPIVAITGSNGKSTVTTLVGEMAKQSGIKVAVGGNLGTPALDLLNEQVELYVLELSSFQLETTTRLGAKVAAVLNLQADHMDRYPSLQAYSAAKARVLKDAERAVVNADDLLVMAMQSAAPRACFTLHEPSEQATFGIAIVDGVEFLCRAQQPLLPLRELGIAGRHNQANALAALAIGSALGLADDSMLEVLRGFPGLPHRTQLVAEIDGVRWYNDSKATNVGAAQAALYGMHKGDGSLAVIVLGGDCKGGDFSELHDTLAQCARAVVLFGRDAPIIREAIPAGIPVREANDMQQVVAHCAELAQPGDHVLLSPACASFDRFRNYQERGEVFSAAVRRLRK